MEVDDNIHIIEVKTRVPAPRRSFKNKLTITEQSHKEIELIKPRTKLPKLKVSPLEKEALKSIVQLKESPPKPLQLSPRFMSSKSKKDKLLAAQAEIKILKEKNLVLKQKNATLISHLTTQMGELAEECTKLRKSIKKKGIQRIQLVNMYKKNISLRADNRKLVEDVYLAKSMLSKKNLAIFLKETTSPSSSKQDDWWAKVFFKFCDQILLNHDEHDIL